MSTLAEWKAARHRPGWAASLDDDRAVVYLAPGYRARVSGTGSGSYVVWDISAVNMAGQRVGLPGIHGTATAIADAQLFVENLLPGLIYASEQSRNPTTTNAAANP